MRPIFGKLCSAHRAIFGMGDSKQAALLLYRCGLFRSRTHLTNPSIESETSRVEASRGSSRGTTQAAHPVRKDAPRALLRAASPMPTFGIRFARGMRFRNFGISLEFALIKILLSFRGAAVYRLLGLAIYASILVTTASSDPTLLRQCTGNPFIVPSDPIVAFVRVTDRTTLQ